MAAITATTAALIGAGVSAAGATANFVQAGKARREANKAADKAGRALQEARDKLQVNFLRGQSIQKEPYELAREAGISTGAQIVQAAQEGDQRGAVAGASRAALAAQQMQNQNRIAMGQELQSLQRAAANEDRNLQRQLVNLDKQEAMGFQNMAADQRARQRELNQAGAQGLVSAGTQLLSAAPLFGQNPNLTQLPNTGAIVDNAALDAQILSPNNPNFGVDSQMFIDPASLNNSGFLDSVSVVDNQTRVA